MRAFLLLTIAYAATHQNAFCSRAVLDLVKAECKSRYYCNSTSIKYMSLSQLNGSYLNGTIIARNKTTTIANCEALCMRTNGCFSINIDISLSNDLDCQLLSSNLYEQRSLLIRNPNFIHLYIKSPSCEKKWCRNDAICIPSYANESYSCQCIRNATFYSWGEYCKNFARGSQAADHFLSFDQVSGKYIYPMAKETTKGYKFNLDNQHLGNKIVRMPGRHGAVAYCKPVDRGSCLQTCMSMVAGLNHLRGCEAGLTYSIWVKFTKEELNRNKRSVIFSHTGVGERTGVAFAAEASRSRGYNFKLANGVKFWQMNFAENVLAQHWTHFAITFHDDVGLCGYVNGVLDKCGGTSYSKTSSLTANGCFRLGYLSGPGVVSGVFLDDFAVWLSPLTESDVKEVYNQGKA